MKGGEISGAKAIVRPSLGLAQLFRPVMTARIESFISDTSTDYIHRSTKRKV
jgi:hypothetical protein